MERSIRSDCQSGVACGGAARFAGQGNSLRIGDRKHRSRFRANSRAGSRVQIDTISILPTTRLLASRLR